MNRHRGSILAWLLVAGFSIYTVCAALRDPFYNWDLIPYVATQYYFDTKDIQVAHQQTMVRTRSLPNYAVLCDVNSYYTNTICTDATALRAQLNFYLARPLYLALVYGIYIIYGDPLVALVLVSAICGGVLSVATGFWVYLRSGWIGLCLVPLLLSFSGINLVSRLQTPDALSAVLVFCGAVLCLESYWRSGLWVLVASLLVRTDTILFLFLLVAYRFFLHERTKTEVLFLILVSAVALIQYGTINHLAGHYGWGITLKHTVSPMPYPAREIAPITTLSEYLDIFRFATHLQFVANPNDLNTLYALIAAALGLVRLELERIYRDFLVLCVSYVVLHYLVFPAFFTRFFLVHNILMWSIFLFGLQRLLHERRSALSA